MRYIDSSVLIAYYTPEARSTEAMTLVRGADICISELTISEVNVALWRKVRAGSLTEQSVERVFSLFDDHCTRGIYLIEPLTRSQVEHVRLIAEELVRRAVDPMRTLDALHAVLAQSLGATLLTFDIRLAAAARALGIDVSP